MNDVIRGVGDVTLREIAPQVIVDDEQLSAVCDALDVQHLAIADVITTYLPYLPNLDNIPERIVDLLAWQYHVDNYDSAAAISLKRTRVRQAIAEHKIQGTLRAVKNALDMLFGQGQYDLLEWFEFDGDPYTFRVNVIMEGELTQELTDQISSSLAATKNVRSHYELIVSHPVETALSIGIGFAHHRIIQRTSIAA